MSICRSSHIIIEETAADCDRCFRIPVFVQRKEGIAVRIRGFKKKLYLLTYDKTDFQKKALQVKRSLDEVKKLLNTKGAG